MAGSTKRRRGGNSAKATASSTSSKSSGTAASASLSSSSQSLLLYKVVSHLTDVYNSKSRCSEALQAFGDGKCVVDEDGSGSSTSTSSPKKKASPTDSEMDSTSTEDCYWIVLATHVMNRLLKRIVSQEQQHGKNHHHQPREEETQIAVVLSCLAYRMASILVSDKGRLEKACCATAAAALSRSLLGRAILTTMASCVWSLQVLTAATPSTSSSTPETMIRSSIEATTIGLDRLVHFNYRGGGYGSQQRTSPKSSGSSPAASTGATSKGRSSNSAEPNFFDDLKVLENLCSRIEASDKKGGASAEEVACLSCLSEPATSELAAAAAASALLPSSESASLSEEPPAKRTSRRSSRPKSKKQATKQQEVQNPSQRGPNDRQSVVSKAFASLIKSTNSGMRMDGRVAVKRWASIGLVWLCQGQARLLKMTYGILTAKIEPDDSAWLVQSTLIACRLLSIVSESGNQSGLRPPTGGMEQYVREILNDKRKKAKSVKADIRDWTTVVMFEVLQRHGRCLERICRDGQTCSVVNDESNAGDDYPRGNRLEQVSSNDSTTLEYCPNLHKLLSQLCRAAAYSVASSSYSDHSDFEKRLTTIAAAFVIQLSCRANCPIDCKLTNFAMTHLAESLRNTEHSGTNKRRSGRDDDDPSPNDNEGSSNDEWVVQMFNLKVTLPEPQVPSVGKVAAKAGTGTSSGGRGKKKQAASSASSTSEEAFSNTLIDPSLCTYAGIIPPIDSERRGYHANHFSDEYVVAHIIRAVGSSSVEGDESSSPGESLLSHLIEIVRRVYDTRTLIQNESSDEENSNDGDDADDDEETKTTRKAGGKRAAESGGTRRRKRQKTSKSNSKSRGGSGWGRKGGKDGKSNTEWKQVTMPRAMLATETLNAVRLCLLIQRPKPASSLRQWIRQSLTTEHIGRIIHLGGRLDRIVVKTRFDIPTSVPPQVELSTRPLGHPLSTSSIFMSATGSHARDFSRYEKDMWCAHMDMCAVLGCGQLDSHGISGSARHRILGDSDRRKIIYLAASASHDAEDADGSLEVLCEDDDDDKNRLWPLWLPAAQYALVTSNLIGEPIPISKDEVAAERFIVRTFVDSIGDVLRNIDTRIRPKKSESDNLRLDDEIPLSLRDSRLFLLAFSRLPLDDKRYCFEELVSMLTKVFGDAGSSRTKEKGSKKRRRNANTDSRPLLKRSSLTGNAEASGFLARVLVTCSSMIHMLKAGVRLRDLLFAIVSGGDSGFVKDSSRVPLPSFSSASQWYTSERCYMGVFSDWRVPSLPSDGPVTLSTGGLKESIIQEWRSLLRKCFALGFASAQSDKCHLLFAAWNGLGNVSFLRNRPTSTGNDFPRLIGRLNSDKEDEDDILCQRFLQLRDDVCTLHRDINQGGGPRSTPSLLSSSRIKANLRSMIVTAEDLLDLILTRHGNTTDDQDEAMGGEDSNDGRSVPVAAFALLRGIPSYIAACVSAHTKPGNDYFSATLSKSPDSRSGSRGSSRRQRGYSSESDRLASDGDSVDSDGGVTESEEDAWSRLRDCCDAFGAAPIHPDWLDVSCRLREGIAPADAAEIAEMALRCLTKLVVAALKQYKWKQYQALKLLHSSSETLGQRVALGLNLCQWSSHEPTAASVLGNPPYSYDREWNDDIASVCGLKPEALEMLLEESAAENVERAKDAWWPNSTQGLNGRLRDFNRLVGGCKTSTAELRARGEWELMLSESLTYSCLAIKSSGSDETDENGPENFETGQKGREAAVEAQQWRTVLVCAVRHLMPAAALLRLGLGRVGRKPHPFSFHENNQDPFDAAPIRFSENLGQPTTTSTSLRKVVFDTLTALTRICVEGDDTLVSSCHAIASHLVIDTKSFVDLEGLQSIRFALIGLTRLRGLVGTIQNDAHNVVPFLVERLTSVIEDYGSIPDAKANSYNEFSRLLAFFGTPRVNVLDTIVQKDVDSFAVLTTGDVPEVVESDSVTYHWNSKPEQSLAISEFISIIVGGSLKANEETRQCLAWMLSRITYLEKRRGHVANRDTPTVVARALISAFNSVGHEKLKGLILQDLCFLSSTSLKIMDERPQPLLQPPFRFDLGLLLNSLLATTRSKAAGFENSRFVYDTLASSFENWSELEAPTRTPILDVFFLYGCRFNSLKDIGSRLVARASSTTMDTVHELEPLTKFLGFVRDLKAALSTASTKTSAPLPVARKGSKDSTNQATSPVGDGDSTVNKYPLSCSFVQKSGFHGQHWYNCYTCGLVWDKGCCTLCALVCHEGHDVCYSRYSSFFCDCGAEDGGASERNRVSCECLSNLPAEQVQSIFDNEAKLLSYDSHAAKKTEEPTLAIDSAGIDIAKFAFRTEALSSIETFLNNAKKSAWIRSVFAIMKRQFEEWKKTNSTKLTLDALLKKQAKDIGDAPRRQLSQPELRRALRKRRAKELNLQPLAENKICPIRAAKGFQFKMSSDSSTNARLVAQLSKHEISRSALVADSRGRVVLAEPSSLVFCSMIPAVSVRYVIRPFVSPLSRSQICILGSSSIKFNIVGLRLCQENERHLVVWGTSDACVVIVKPNWNGVEENIDLAFDLEQQEGEIDYLVKCEWIPGSQTHVCVGCGKFVRIYDISRKAAEREGRGGDTVAPVIGYNLGFESGLRDMSIVPDRRPFSKKDNADANERISKLFLLLENGRLHVVNLKTTANGKLESPGDQHFEPSECVTLTTAGVRSRVGSALGLAGSSSHSLGEGSRLAYLKQSRTLLYKCTTSCVLALMLSKKGDVEGSFELLPHSISNEALGGTGSEAAVTGPYTHWVELGVVYRNGSGYFRIACVGKSPRSHQPKLIYIEFNEKEVKIRELTWPAGSSGLGLSGMSLSYEGLAAFSAPIACSPSDQKLVFGERVFLCAITADSILCFGEDVLDAMPPSERGGEEQVARDRLGGRSAKMPTFPLTLFEKLKNVSESNEVVFGGDGIGSDPDDLRTRLSRDSSVFLMCPRREGCVLTVSLKQKQSESGDTNSKSGDSRPGDLIIAAIRILVGSTSPACIPSKIFIEGRPVDLTPGVKKWYSLPLTEEEIALSVRNGLVSVGVGPSFESSHNPLVDSVEVYAAERTTVEPWLPQSHTSTGSETTLAKERPDSVGSGISTADAPDSPNGLVSSAVALTHLCSLLQGYGKFMSDAERSFLKQLVQETTLDRTRKVTNCVESLLEHLEPDARARNSLFYDESKLLGCMKVLSHCHEWQLGVERDFSNLNAKWNAVKLVLQDCLKSAAAIARERPMNYLQTSGSIAVDASKLILEGLGYSPHYEDMIGGPGGIVDLTLTEMAIELNTDTPQSKKFAKFDVIRSLLESNKPSVVERCCEAVSSFCRKHGRGTTGEASTNDLFTLLQSARLVAYQCDSCSVMIEKIRYTLEEDHDIDLCEKCFRLGERFAASKKFSAKVNVVINGKTVGAETKLTCAQIRQMKPVSFEKMDVEQVDVQSENSAEEEEELQKALRLSLGENIEEEKRESPASNQAYEDFVGHLFSSIVDLLSSVLKRDRCPHVGPLIRLLLDQVRHSEVGKLDRAKRFAKELSLGVSHILKSCACNKKLPEDKVLTLVTCLRAFSNLLVPEADSQYYLVGSHPDERAEEPKHLKTKEKTYPPLVCVVHNLPAVRRRCARGANKDRRFYICGKERGSRCKYFVWADEVEKKVGQESKKKSHFHKVFQAFLWSHFTAGNIHQRLCRLLEEEVFGDDVDSCDITVGQTSSANDKKTEKTQLKSFRSPHDAEKDLVDGVLCSREKLQDFVSDELAVSEAKDLSGSQADRGALLLEASLDLLSLIADHKTEGISRWFSLLCEINISTNKPSSLRSLAKKVLKTMCGGKRSLFHSVRDHFAFGFQIRSLFWNSSNALGASLIVKEKARQSGPNWDTDDNIGWDTISTGSFLGAADLVPEDAHSQLSDSKIGKVLDELLPGIKNRGESWRRFCGLSSLPHSHREKKRSEFEGESNLAAVAPIISIFWIACCLKGANQVKMLRLVDLALINWKDRKAVIGKTEGSSSDGEANDADGEDEVIPLSDETFSVPEKLLLEGPRRMTVDDIIAFSMQFVYGGKTVDLRRIAGHVALKLCTELSAADAGKVFQRLIGPHLGEIGGMGKACLDFLSLLQSICRLVDESTPVPDVADLIMTCSKKQLNAVKFDKSNGQWAVLEVGGPGSSVLKKKFDISDCVYCLRTHLPTSKETTHGKTSDRRDSSGGASRSSRGGGASPGDGSASSGRATSSSGSPPSHNQTKWHPEQISPYARGRLSPEASASNEFCSFYTLKYRLSISDIHLTVNDPRGRFVKTITVYFTPRPVDDVSILKEEDYADNWQPCATMNLTRGSSRASATLSQPVVAANLKVEFTDFYERPGGSKASDGTLIVHCPRCTRPVTSAHGICASCGEVAFQCRKCRHINYDRLDAFLCVECGYCASGNFSFDLTAGVASNAIAISNDDEFEKINKMLGAATSLHEDLRQALKERVRGAPPHPKKPKRKELDSMFNPALKQAFLGLPPIPGSSKDGGSSAIDLVEKLEKQGAVGKVVARPDSSSPGGRSSAAADRTRSLLRLARQIRSESGSSGERRRSSDVIIRHLGRGLAIDNLDDENDLIGLLEGGNVPDSSDSLSRAINSARGRSSSGGSGNRGRDSSGGGGGDRPSPRKKTETSKEILADCERLHLLMREAERESYELKRRVQAWRRLENDELADVGTLVPVPIAFCPSHCSSCSGAVGLQLLVLWLRLFHARPNDVQIDPDFLCLLIEDLPSSSKSLFDFKRQVVREIATKSEEGAKLVLAELRKRLTATRDVASSEILGKIMEVEGVSMSEEYTKLAMEVLSSTAQGSI